MAGVLTTIDPDSLESTQLAVRQIKRAFSDTSDPVSRGVPYSLRNAADRVYRAATAPVDAASLRSLLLRIEALEQAVKDLGGSV